MPDIKRKPLTQYLYCIIGFHLSVTNIIIIFTICKLCKTIYCDL